MVSLGEAKGSRLNLMLYAQHPQSAGLDKASAKEYLHIQNSAKQLCSQSSATSSSSLAESTECSRSCQQRSDVETYGSRHHNYGSKSSFSQRQRSPSGSASPTSSRRYSDREHRMRRARDHPQASRCIGVFGLHTQTTQHKVRALFNKFGPIERIQMVIDAHTHRSRGFCFIYYENIADARAAKDACSGMDVDGRRIRVDYSITQRPHTPTPGVYMGRPARESRSRRRQRDSASLSPHDSRRRKYRSSRRYERSSSRSRSYSRSRSPRKSRHLSRY